jgi:hypothetical protein
VNREYTIECFNVMHLYVPLLRTCQSVYMQKRYRAVCACLISRQRDVFPHGILEEDTNAYDAGCVDRLNTSMSISLIFYIRPVNRRLSPFRTSALAKYFHQFLYTSINL